MNSWLTVRQWPLANAFRKGSFSLGPLPNKAIWSRDLWANDMNLPGYGLSFTSLALSGNAAPKFSWHSASCQRKWTHPKDSEKAIRYPFDRGEGRNFNILSPFGVHGHCVLSDGRIPSISKYPIMILSLFLRLLWAVEKHPISQDYFDLNNASWSTSSYCFLLTV